MEFSVPTTAAAAAAWWSALSSRARSPKSGPLTFRRPGRSGRRAWPKPCLWPRVIRGRVFYHRHLVAKLSGKANRCLHARVCYEPDDDELMNAMLLKLQIQIGVGKATGTPMLRGDNVAWLRLEPGTDLATPGPVCEGLSQSSCLLNRS